MLASSVIVRKLPISASIYCVSRYFLYWGKSHEYWDLLFNCTVQASLLQFCSECNFQCTISPLGDCIFQGGPSILVWVCVLMTCLCYFTPPGGHCNSWISRLGPYSNILSDSKNLNKAFIAFNKQSHGIWYLKDAPQYLKLSSCENYFW